MKKVFTLLLLLSACTVASSQDFGLSFSYFIPKNGYFSTPISPFSLRGVGIDFGEHIGVQTGFSVYRMSGLGVTDIPFESKDPLIGPTFTILVPLELVLKVGNNTHTFSVKGGGFAFYSFDQKLNYGNIDKALRKRYNLDIVNADMSIENKIGYGYQFGAEYLVYVTKQVGVSLEANYYKGGADLGLKGSYIGGNNGKINAPVQVDYPDSRIDFTGLEFSIGFIYSAGR